MKRKKGQKARILSYNKDKMYDVIQSLKRLINDCKEDSQISPAMADLCINRLPEFIKIYDQYVEKMKKNNNKKHIEEMAECSKKFLQYIQQVEVAQENLLKDSVDAFKTTLENNADTLNNSI